MPTHCGRELCDASLSRGEEPKVTAMRSEANEPVCITANAVRGECSYQPIRRILCATDMSPRCDGAVRRAEMLAKRTNALLLLLHVIDESLSPELLGESTAEQARRKLMARQPTSIAEVIVRHGSPYRTIARVANKWDADLVVLGARRHRAGARFVGTITERIIDTVKRAVLIVNGEPTGPYRDVLLASDLPAAFAQVVSLTQRLGLLEGARASIVQVLENGSDSMSGASGVLTSQIDRHMQWMRQSSRADLVAQLDAAGLHSARFSLIQKHGQPFAAIARVIEELRPQLVVLGATHHPCLKRLFGTSVTDGVLRNADCDVFIASAAAVLHGRDDWMTLARSDHVRDAGARGWTASR
jgi:nucleotide-binding universal stress UspA family protein